MRKNRLYTVNKWNKPLFEEEAVSLHTGKRGNVFEGGGDTESNGFNTAWKDAAAAQNTALSSVKTDDPRGAWDTMDPIYHITGAGNKSSKAGDTMQDTGIALTKSGSPWLMLAGAGLKIGGDFVNAGWGIGTDEEKLGAMQGAIAKNQNYKSNAKSFDDLGRLGPKLANTAVYEGGWYTGSDANDMNIALNDALTASNEWVDNSYENNVRNINRSQLGYDLANYNAYGGDLLGKPRGAGYWGAMGLSPWRNTQNTGALGIMQQDKYLESIDKRSEAISKSNENNLVGKPQGTLMADGGNLLAYDFINGFKDDPIGAVVRYNKGLEDLAAREELLRRSEEQALQNAALQKQMEELRLTPPNFNINISQEYGTDGMPIAPKIDIVPLEPTTISKGNPELGLTSLPSKAAINAKGNKNWSYIENELRKSGKFNDVQIQGIKYNLQRESSINPDLVGDGGAAFGLGQWHGSRQPADRSLEGQTKHLIETLSNYDGTEHWVGKSNYEGFMNARTPEEAHYYIAKGYERPKDSIVAKVKRDSDMSLKKLNAFGGELGTNGTDFTNGLLYIDEGGSHESNPLEGVPMGLDAEGIPNLVEEGETVYNNYVFSNRLKVPTFMYKELGLGGALTKHHTKHKGISFADASKKLAQESEQRPNDPISIAGLEASLSRLAEVQEAERMKKEAKEYRGLEQYACGGNMKHKYGNGSSNFDYGEDLKMPTLEEWLKKSSQQDLKLSPEMTVPEKLELSKGLQETLNNNERKLAADYIRSREDTNKYDTWMRYAPAVGAGAMVLTDALGLTNKPDYRMAERLEAAAQVAGLTPNIKFKPVGDYMKYEPLDRMFQQNQLNAIARAADRTIVNSSLPTASKYAALLAANYNNQIAAGNLFRQEQESNRAQYERKKEYDRKTNMFNSQMDLEAAMANARYHQAAQQMGLSGLAQAAALRDSIDARLGAAKAANISNFLTSLGNIGRENFAMNQINSDRSRSYKGDLSGGSSYKRISACGGKINRRK